MTVYYNEIDHKAAAWLRELIKQGLIAPGVVDERSIVDVKPADLLGYRQCHFFAGIGVWSYALRQAGWPDDREVWTGSCPCQPFSTAGKGKGKDDERHLWPEFYRLIKERKPNAVFGEQVGSKSGLSWLDDVQSDLEASQYTCGAVTFPACSIGSPHQRQRIYWVAKSRLANDHSQRCQPGREVRSVCEKPDNEYGSAVSRLANAKQEGSQGWLSGRQNQERENIDRHARCSGSINNPGPTNGIWKDVDWLYCRDGKWRPVEPGTFPLVNGASARVGRLRGYGNAIVAEQAKIFIETSMDCINAKE